MVSKLTDKDATELINGNSGRPIQSSFLCAHGPNATMKGTFRSEYMNAVQLDVCDVQKTMIIKGNIPGVLQLAESSSWTSEQSLEFQFEIQDDNATVATIDHKYISRFVDFESSWVVEKPTLGYTFASEGEKRLSFRVNF